MKIETELETKLLDTAMKTMLLVRQELQASASFGLSISQFRLLDQLFRGVTTTSELAERQGVSLPAMSGLVDVLVRRNLAQRSQRASDSRVIELSLTRRGRHLLEKARGAAERMLHGRIQELNAAEVSRLKEGLEVLAKLVMPEPKSAPALSDGATSKEMQESNF